MEKVDDSHSELSGQSGHHEKLMHRAIDMVCARPGRNLDNGACSWAGARRCSPPERAHAHSRALTRAPGSSPRRRGYCARGIPAHRSESYDRRRERRRADRPPEGRGRRCRPGCGCGCGLSSAAARDAGAHGGSYSTGAYHACWQACVCSRSPAATITGQHTR
jgi:hypothetical protein